GVHCTCRDYLGVVSKDIWSSAVVDDVDLGDTIGDGEPQLFTDAGADNRAGDNVSADLDLLAIGGCRRGVQFLDCHVEGAGALHAVVDQKADSQQQYPARREKARRRAVLALYRWHTGHVLRTHRAPLSDAERPG